MTKKISITDEAVILIIRSVKVMIDSDLADLYAVSTKRLNEQVKRNVERFPEDFMFQLSREEKDEVVANCDHLANLKYSSFLPNVFTEHGAVMLTSVINNDTAIQANIQIVRVFIKMRSMLTDNLSLKLDVEKIKKKLENQDKNIELVFSYLDELIEKQNNPKPRKKIGFKSKGKK